MSDLSKAYFECELSEGEEQALAAELEGSDAACEGFARAAAADYRRSGFPNPAGQRSRKRWWVAGTLLALGAAWAAWPARGVRTKNSRASNRTAIFIASVWMRSRCRTSRARTRATARDGRQG